MDGAPVLAVGVGVAGEEDPVTGRLTQRAHQTPVGLVGNVCLVDERLIAPVLHDVLEVVARRRPGEDLVELGEDVVTLRVAVERQIRRCGSADSEQPQHVSPAVLPVGGVVVETLPGVGVAVGELHERWIEGAIEFEERLESSPHVDTIDRRPLVCRQFGLESDLTTPEHGDRHGDDHGIRHLGGASLVGDHDSITRRIDGHDLRVELEAIFDARHDETLEEAEPRRADELQVGRRAGLFDGEFTVVVADRVVASITDGGNVHIHSRVVDDAIERVGVGVQPFGAERDREVDEAIELPDPAAEGRRRFEHLHVHAGPGQEVCRRETRRSSADDHDRSTDRIGLTGTARRRVMVV